MACTNQLHQTIVLTQTESDDEEIDVITVDVSDEEKLSQDLEFDLLSKIEFEIDSDSDEFVDVVTISPVKQKNSKINKKASNKSDCMASQSTINGFSNIKLNNNSEEQCPTMRTSKRKLVRLGIEDDNRDNDILKMYASKRRTKNTNRNGETKVPKGQNSLSSFLTKFNNKSTSIFRKSLVENDKVSNDKTDFIKKREKRNESKNEQTSKILINKTDSTTDALKLKSSVKIILSKVDFNSNDAVENDKLMKKTLRTSAKSASEMSISRVTVNKRSKRINIRQMKGGKKAVVDHKATGQTSLKAKRKYTRNSDKQNRNNNN